MSEAIRFLEALLEERLAHLHTAMPARIQRFDETTGTADAVPLFMRKFRGQSPEQLPLLVDLPVLKRRYRDAEGEIRTEVPVYLPGDIVLILFCERALDGALAAGVPVDPGYSRKHALDDGVIIGLLRG